MSRTDDNFLAVCLIFHENECIFFKIKFWSWNHKINCFNLCRDVKSCSLASPFAEYFAQKFHFQSIIMILKQYKDYKAAVFSFTCKGLLMISLLQWRIFCARTNQTWKTFIPIVLTYGKKVFLKLFSVIVENISSIKAQVIKCHSFWLRIRLNSWEKLLFVK